jgi:hypothetical protein
MQVTAAAAIDVGGGDRFDVAENRLLGRAYLARMYRRYGNWPDAVAAYNWGPGNVDSWIGAGRAADRLPLEVERYRDRVLRVAALADPSAVMLSGGWPYAIDAAKPEEEPTPVIRVVDEALLIAAAGRAALAGGASLHNIIAAVLSRAANWKLAYSALGSRITWLIEKHTSLPERRDAEYTASADPTD